MYESGSLHGTATFISHTGDKEERCYVAGRSDLSNEKTSVLIRSMIPWKTSLLQKLAFETLKENSGKIGT